MSAAVRQRIAQLEIENGKLRERIQELESTVSLLKKERVILPSRKKKRIKDENEDVNTRLRKYAKRVTGSPFIRVEV